VSCNYLDPGPDDCEGSQYPKIKSFFLSFFLFRAFVRGDNPRFLVMMMIAFIPMNSGLVPLIEGLCAQILYFKFEILVGLRSHLLLFFFGRKNM